MNVWKLMLTLLMAAALGLALNTGCKQQDGERCEWDEDCASGLQCCSGSNLCRESCTSGHEDAAVTQNDAAVQEDAEVVQNDAEATIDASVTQDASP